MQHFARDAGRVARCRELVGHRRQHALRIQITPGIGQFAHRAIERIGIQRVQRSILLQPLDQIRIGNERTTERDQIDCARFHCLDCGSTVVTVVAHMGAIEECIES